MRYHLTGLCAVVLLLCALSGQAQGAPDCYIKADVPAHEWALMNAESAATTPVITGLTQDGLHCERILLWQGEPVMVQPILSPFRQLMESYAKALIAKDAAALQRLYAWLRPTPRTFAQFVELSFVQEGFPMDMGGNATAAQLVSLLQTTPQMKDSLVTVRSNNIITVSLEHFWPALYTLLGGVILPDLPDVWTRIQPGSGGVRTATLLAASALPTMVFLVQENEKQAGQKDSFSVRGEGVGIKFAQTRVQSTPDDPRLNDVLFLQTLEATGNPVEPPVVVSAEGYVRLHPKLEKRLLGSLRVYPHNPVQETGPMLPVTAQFSAIADRVDYNMRRQDFDHILKLKAKILAAPLAPESVLELLRIPLWPEKDVYTLLQHLKLSVPQVSSGKGMGYGESPGLGTGRRYLLPMAEIFYSFRGKLASPHTIAVFRSSNMNPERLAQIKAKFAEFSSKDTLLVPLGAYYGSRCVHILHLLGFNVVNF